MKHHIKSETLKDFKKFMWNLRSKNVQIEFYINDKLDNKINHDEQLLLNYGIVQTDKNGNIISSNDSSYNYYYRRLAENDKWEYYQLTFDFKGKPQIKIYLINRNLEFKYDESAQK